MYETVPATVIEAVRTCFNLLQRISGKKDGSGFFGPGVTFLLEMLGQVTFGEIREPQRKDAWRRNVARAWATPDGGLHIG
jgi:hypothetical protein